MSMRPIDLSYLVRAATNPVAHATPGMIMRSKKPLRIAGMPKHQTGYRTISAAAEVRRRERLRPFTDL